MSGEPLGPGGPRGSDLLAPARRPAGHTLVLAFVTAGTVWATLLSWRVLTSEGARYYVPLFVLAAIIATIGGFARWLRVPWYAYVPVQVLVTAGLTLYVVTGSALPTPTTFETFLLAYDDAVVSAQSYMAPVPANAPPIHPLLIIGGALGLLLGDVLVGALRRVPVAGLLLLSLYALPATVTGRGGSVWVFVVAAAGFLAMLFVVQDEQVGRWGRPMDAQRRGAEADPAGFGVRTGAVRGSAVAIGSAATALAVTLPALIPTFDVTFFDGPGPGDGSLEVTSPVADMRRDLQRGADVPLLWVTSPREEAPSYLRISVLSNYSGDEWTPGDREIPEDQVAQGELPPLQGVAGTLDRRETPYSVQVSPGFESTWLPTMPLLSEINAGADWRYDTETMDFFAVDDQTTAGIRYDMVGVDLELDPASMDRAVAGSASVAPIFTQLPSSFPSQIRQLAQRVTADSPTRFRKAQTLQRWFRSEGGFTYDLTTVDSLGSGTEDLLAFLDEDGRRGYCEQYAAAMAVMARSLGIPARVAIGFLQPEASGPRTWEYSAHDLHAWPELYFPGSGWVRFEPTPGDRAGQVPGYSDAELAPLPEPSSAPSGDGQEEDLPERGEEDADPAAGEDGTDAGGSAVPWRAVGGAALALVAAAGLLLTPRLVRQRRREGRRRHGSVEAAWTEVRDTALDLGHPWPRGRSPREVAGWLVTLLGDRNASLSDRPAGPDGSDRPRRGPDQDPEAARALQRLVGWVEQSRYAAASDPVADEDLRQATQAVVDSLLAGVGPRVRRRAEWWPASVRRRERQVPRDETRRTVVTGRGTSAGSGVVDQMG